MERQAMKILYGLTLEISEYIREKIEQKLTDKGVELFTICRYRKEGIHQYMKTQKDIVLILEENLQGSSPYEHQDLVHLTDIGFHKIIFLLGRQHYGSEYIKILYVCGILNAIFLDEVTPEMIVKLISHGRTNEEARDYYGIQTLRDAEKKCNVVNTENLNSFLEYIEEGSSEGEVNERYRFTATRLGKTENEALLVSLPPHILRLLQGNEVYQFYKKNNREKRNLFWKRKIVKPESLLMKEDLRACKAPSLNPNAETQEPNRVENEPIKTIRSIESQEIENGEDMLTILEQFRTRQIEEKNTVFTEVQEQTDLLMDFGLFLRQIDN